MPFNQPFACAAHLQPGAVDNQGKVARFRSPAGFVSQTLSGSLVECNGVRVVT